MTKHTFRAKTWLAMLVCLVALPACESNHYDISMTPSGDSLHRELTCWRESE